MMIAITLHNNEIVERNHLELVVSDIWKVVLDSKKPAGVLQGSSLTWYNHCP